MAEPTGQTTIIGADTKIKGEMVFDGTARLLGQFEGTITAKGELQVAEGATCRATVDAGKLMVDGIVEGNVTARDRVELTSKARVKGDVIAAKMVVAEGASFSGHCTVGADAVKAAVAAAKSADADSGLHEVKAAVSGGAARPEPQPQPARR